MRLYVSSEHRFGRFPDGSIASLTGGREYTFWQRYLEVFDRVTVIARVSQDAIGASPEARADGPGVDFVSLSNYQGPKQLMRQIPHVTRQVFDSIDPDSAYLLRVPGMVGNLVALALRRKGQPYGVEVVGDPAGVFAAGASQDFARSLARWVSVRALRRQAAGAVAATYVTERALQSSYPTNGNAFQTYFSDVELPESAFVTKSRAAKAMSHPVIVTVGSLAQPYKGVDVLISALARCKGEGLQAQLRVVGDGRYRAELEQRAAEHGLSDDVVFLGQLPREGVQAQLDAADLFVMASRTEGLPRAMIEAMARALPCIGTDVGGIPELLPAQHLVPPNDEVHLAAKMLSMFKNPGLMAESSVRNLEKAHEYRHDVLLARRLRFYEELRRRTCQWIKGANV